MNYRKSVKVSLPHNYSSDGRDGIKLEKLIRTAWELGGTVYEVAKDAGLFSTYEFMESLFDDSVVPEPIYKDDMTVVTEVYVRHLDTLERVFLASNRFPLDRKLLEIGNIDEGRLIISYDQLKYLHERGYSCFYQRSDKTDGAISNRYKEVFGMDQKMIPFKMWDVYCTYVGSGYNQALLVRTMFETVLVMPDTYAVEQCVKVVYAEKMIQERFDPTFCIERIRIDSIVTQNLESAYLQLFGISQMKGYAELPDSYQKLVEQFAYIKTYYPTVCDQVWVEHFRLDDEPRTVVDLEGEEGKQVRLGISISEYDGCYAMFEDRFGRIHRIPNIKSPAELPLFQKYEFRCCGDMRNAGVAASRLALNFRDIVTSAFFLFDVDAKDIYITFGSPLPTNMQIDNFIRNRERYIENHEIPKEEDVSLIAYDEAPFTSDSSGNDIPKWAAELAELPNINIVEKINAVVAAFEDFDSKNTTSLDCPTLQEQERGLIFEIGENRVQLILFEKTGEDSFREIAFESRSGIVTDTYYEDDDILEDGYNPNIDYVLCDELDSFMLDAGLRTLGIYSNSADNVDAYIELHKEVPRVREQLRRCDSAKVYFKNDYLEMTEDFPIERLETWYERLLDRNTLFLEKFLKDNFQRMERIAKVYAIGSEWEYPFVRRYMEEVIGSKICYLAPFAGVEARGAAVIEKKISQKRK